MLPNHILALCAGVLLDFIIGDPYVIPHPIRFIGNLISRLEKLLYKNISKKEISVKDTLVKDILDKELLFRGRILVIAVVCISTFIPAVILLVLYNIHMYAGFLAETIMCWQILAAKSLKKESMKVYDALKEGDIEKSRYALSMIVGRDTLALDETKIIKAAVETVAENTSDGEIAPMIFIAIGGPVLGFFYKAVNTMDSMVGYKNDKYLYFGRCAAKLDDILNYVPARISGVLMIVACFFTRMDIKSAYRIWRRDGRNHASPNSAQTEAVTAGALGIQLAGNAYYFGKLYEKPTIGDAKREAEFEDILRANRLLYATAIIQTVVIVLLYGVGMWMGGNMWI